MAEDLRIPGYLFGAFGEERVNEPTLKLIKEETERQGGRILVGHAANWELDLQLRQGLGLIGLKRFEYQQMAKATFGIGDVSERSIGVGREIERLLNILRVPVLALRSCESSYQSALIDGEDDPMFKLHVYQSEADLRAVVAHFMKRVKNLQGIYS